MNDGECIVCKWMCDASVMYGWFVEWRGPNAEERPPTAQPWSTLPTLTRGLKRTKTIIEDSNGPGLEDSDAQEWKTLTHQERKVAVPRAQAVERDHTVPQLTLVVRVLVHEYTQQGNLRQRNL